MTQWEYARLVRRTQPGGDMTIVWYMPDGSREDRSQSGEGAKTLPHLNHAGWQGWELVAVTEDYRPERSELRIERYHFKRMVS